MKHFECRGVMDAPTPAFFQIRLFAAESRHRICPIRICTHWNAQERAHRRTRNAEIFSVGVAVVSAFRWSAVPRSALRTDERAPPVRHKQWRAAELWPR